MLHGSWKCTTYDSSSHMIVRVLHVHISHINLMGKAIESCMDNEYILIMNQKKHFGVWKVIQKDIVIGF